MQVSRAHAEEKRCSSGASNGDYDRCCLSRTDWQSKKGRGGRILLLNIVSDRDFSNKRSRFLYNLSFERSFSAIYASCSGNTEHETRWNISVVKRRWREASKFYRFCALAIGRIRSLWIKKAFSYFVTFSSLCFISNLFHRWFKNDVVNMVDYVFCFRNVFKML